MLKTIKNILQSSKIDKLDSELLLAYILKKPREYVISHPQEKISKIQNTKYKRLTKKRLRGMPLSYLTGHKEFFGLDFLVNKHVLIPRPETEMIVDEVLSILKNNDKAILIDIGTGSGCIPISIASTSQQLKIITPQILATDISRRALKVAKKNAKKNNVKIKFLHGNLLEPIFSNVTMKQLNNVIITANLPYLTKQQYKSETSIQHEPKLALVAQNQGLSLYEKFFKQIKLLATNYKLPITTIIEIDPSQSKLIQIMIKKYHPNSKIEVKKDLAGLNREILLKKF